MFVTCVFLIPTEQIKEPDPYRILILSVGAGKTNKNKVAFGRFMYHINPVMCGFGTFALYLLCRFNLTEEHLQMNFPDNETWPNKNLICTIPQKKYPRPLTSLVIARRRYSRARVRSRTVQNTLAIIQPCILIQNIVMLPYDSVATQFASTFHNMPKVFPHAPVFIIRETVFLVTQINSMNDANTSPMVQVIIGQTDSQG